MRVGALDSHFEAQHVAPRAQGHSRALYEWPVDVGVSDEGGVVHYTAVNNCEARPAHVDLLPGVDIFGANTRVAAGGT